MTNKLYRSNSPSHSGTVKHPCDGVRRGKEKGKSHQGGLRDATAVKLRCNGYEMEVDRVRADYGENE